MGLYMLLLIGTVVVLACLVSWRNRKKSRIPHRTDRANPQPNIYDPYLVYLRDLEGY